MDSKKTNLTPELKEIYDRVMNTSATPKAPATPPPSSQPPVAAPNMPTSPPIAGAPNIAPISLQPPISPIPSIPQMPASPIAPQSSPNPMPTMPQLPNTNLGMSPMSPSPAEQALSNTPARPLSEGNTFSFNGVAQSPQAANGKPAMVAAKKGSKISLPILIVLGLVFVVIWGIFWAILFGFIKR